MRITVKFVVFLCLYAADIYICLHAIKIKQPKLYAPAKILLMPLLLGCYLNILSPALRGLAYQRFVVSALVFHCMGDTLLLFPKHKTRKFFFGGMLAFLLGHISYTLWFARADVGHSRPLAFITVVLMTALEYAFYRQLMLGPRKYAPALVPYSFGLAVLAVAIASTFGNGSPWYATLISLLGVFTFAFSDYCIARREVRMPIGGPLTVMSTYITAQTLIITGMLLLQV